jgi:hypothetical protein
MTKTNETELYTAVYSNVDDALADLEAVKKLQKDELIGNYDAAVVQDKDGKPTIVKRLDHPAVRIIPETFGGGHLKRKELMDAAKELSGNEAGLILVGEPTLEKAFDKAVTRAIKTVKHTVDVTAEELAKEMKEAQSS